MPVRSLGILERAGGILFKPLWGPGVKDLYFFTIGLRSCLSAGIPILRAFEIMSESSQHRSLRDACLAVSREVAAGAPIEKAVRSRPRVFSPFFTNLLMTGLNTGTLPHTLGLLAEHYVAILELRRAVFRVVWYPLSLLFAGALVMSARDFIIRSYQSEVRLSEALWILWTYFGPLCLGIVAAFALSRAVKARRARPVTDEIVMRVPIIGTCFKRYSLAIFFQALAASVEAGCELITGFAAARDAMDNCYLAKRLRRAESHLRDGESLAEAFSLTGVMDSEALGMISTGEVSGSLPELLRKMATRHVTEVRGFLPASITALSPFLLIVVAIAFFANPSVLGYGAFVMFFLLFLTI